MVNIVDAKDVLANWLDTNVVTRIPGEGKRVVFAVMANRVLSNLQALTPALEKHPMVAVSGLIDGGKIDESILVEIREGLKGGKLELPVPLLGTITLDGEALNSLYQMLVSTRS